MTGTQKMQCRIKLYNVAVDLQHQKDCTISDSAAQVNIEIYLHLTIKPWKFL